MEELQKELSKYGDVQVCKKDYVFTLFLTGVGLDNFNKFVAIKQIVSAHVVNEYPNVEVFRIEDDYLLMVLKP